MGEPYNFYILVKAANLMMKCKVHFFFPASHGKYAFRSCLHPSTPAPTRINKQKNNVLNILCWPDKVEKRQVGAFLFFNIIIRL